MATEYKLEVQKRDQYGKKASKHLRNSGAIPGIYYSSDSKESISFSITKKEILDRLEIIKDSMDSDFLNRHTIEGIVKDITELQWQINTNMEDCR